jgi:hypothetical protein
VVKVSPSMSIVEEKALLVVVAGPGSLAVEI